ncbi:MAG TPA: DnaD domain protein [Dehalococcoidia bacterium]|nr:DnaD domain protein [Dehalococcoidia bacterium]
MSYRQLSSSQKETGFISLPESFFTQTVPKIQDLAELKVALYVAYLILRKPDPSTQRSKCSVTYNELESEICRLSAELNKEALRQALDSAVKHGILLHSTLNTNGMLEDVYSLTIDILQPPTINIFALYEQNIGMITPMIAEELKEAERLYPPQWIAEALKEAVTLNKRSWKYIVRILERWASEGKDSGEYKRDTKKDGPDKYIKGKYGHLVKR